MPAVFPFGCRGEARAEPARQHPRRPPGRAPPAVPRLLGRAGRGAGAHQDGHAPIVHSPRERARGMAHTEFAPRPARGESALHEHDRRPACPCHLGRFSGQGLSRPARAEPELSTSSWRNTAGTPPAWSSWPCVSTRLPAANPHPRQRGRHHALAGVRGSAAPSRIHEHRPPSGAADQDGQARPTSRTCTSAGPGPGGGAPRCRATQPSAAARAPPRARPRAGALRRASQAVPARGTSRAGGAAAPGARPMERPPRRARLSASPPRTRGPAFPRLARRSARPREAGRGLPSP